MDKLAMSVELVNKKPGGFPYAVLTAINALFLLLIFSLGFMQPNIKISGYPIPLTDFLFLAVFALWALALLLKLSWFRWNRFYLVLIPYLGAMILSTAYSDDLKKSFVKLLGEIYLLGLAVLTINIVQTEEMARRTIYAWLAATSIVCVVSVLTLLLFYLDRDSTLLNYTLSHYGTLPPGNYPRVLSTFLNANMLCNYLNVSVVLLLAAYRQGWIERRLFVPLTALILVAIFLTISPGIGGILLCVGLWLWIDSKEKGRFAVAWMWLGFGILAAGIFFISILMAPNADPLAEFQIEPISGWTIFSSVRVSTWMAASQTIAENPFFGRGLGLDAVQVYSYNASGHLYFVSDAHQLWLNFIAQTGIPGFFAICLLTIYLFRKSLPLSFDKSPNSVLRVTFGLAFVGAFLYQGLGGSFEDARHLWVLIGLLAGFGDRGD